MGFSINIVNRKILLRMYNCLMFLLINGGIYTIRITQPMKSSRMVQGYVPQN